MIFTSLCTDPPPPSLSKNPRRSPLLRFLLRGRAEGRGGGGMYTRPDFHVHLLFHLLHYTEKKLHCDCREKKYTYPARSSIHSPYFQQARRLFIFPSQLMAICFISQPGQILPEERVFCRSGSVGYSSRKVF